MTYTTFPAIPAHKSSPGLNLDLATLEAKMGDGYVQASIDGLNNEKETWALQWENEDIADVNTITAFVKARAGAEPFYWTPPYEVTAKLWRCKNIKVSPSGPYAATIDLSFERYYGP